MLTPACPRRRGVAAVELALLLPFLVLVFLVAIDFCRIFHTTQTLQSCAEAAALYASGTAQPPPNTSTTDAATAAAVADGAALNPPLAAANIRIQTTDTTATVTITYPFQTAVPYPGMAQAQTLVRTVQMSVAPKVGQGN